MRHTSILHRAVFMAFVTMSGSAMSQPQDSEAIKSANVGFCSAVSARDVVALGRVWDHDGQVFNIFGVSKAPMIGWNAVRGGYEDLFNRFPEISVNMPEPAIRQDGDSAVVVGVETQKVRLPNGETVSALLPATNVFVKRDGQWLWFTTTPPGHRNSTSPPGGTPTSLLLHVVDLAPR
jgi:ketosteroid isomerase-like protein